MNWGVGLSVTLRMRMGAHDAHYAGDLVDGARMLALFGDVATELLVRLDGDEGLFRAYDVVEFLAPVFAGDFVEATGVIAAVGNTSRRIVFEARKVAGNVRASGLAPSAADMYEQPVVVCRAEGTCVVPLALQRKSHAAGKALPAPDFSDASLALGQGRVVVPPAPHYVITPVRKTPPEVILTAAIVGAEVTRDKTPHLPITAAEIADEAARCRDAGAAIVHLHVRDAQGKPSQSAALFREAILAIQAKTDVIIQTSTGGAVGMSIEERAQPLDLYPEMATLNCGSVNFGNEVFVNTRAEIRNLSRRIRAAGATPELECYEVGHIHEALHLKEEGLLTDPLHFQFVLGIPGAIKAKEEVVAFMASQLPPAASWGVAAVGPYQEPMTEAAMRLGGHARVGLEDNIYLSKGVLAEGSAPLVARAAAFARSIGRSPVEPMRARALLGMVTRERR